MTSQEGKTQSLLACPECGIGWADCACVSSWSTPEEKEKRDAEIRAIKAEVYEKIEKRARPTKSFSKVVAAFDSTLLAELQERGGSRGLSSYVVKLFTTHSSRKKVVSRQSSVVRVEQKSHSASQATSPSAWNYERKREQESVGCFGRTLQ